VAVLAPVPEVGVDGWIARLDSLRDGTPLPRGELAGQSGREVGSAMPTAQLLQDRLGETAAASEGEVTDGWLARLAEVQAGAAPAVVSIQRVLDPVPLLSSMVLESAQARAAFVAGYRAAGGPPELEAHFADTVIPKCEWTLGWGVPWYDTGNGYVSVAQFTPGSWASAGGGNPTDPWVTGRNVANWLNLGVDPGGTGGWPTCFWK